MPLPGGDWTLAAAPAGGWTVPAGAGWPIGLLTLLSAALIVLPMIRTRRLVGERQKNILELRDREAELARLSRRLGLALDASKVGVWDYNIDSDTLVWDERMEELYGYAPFTRGHTYADWRDRLHPDDLARAADEFREAIEVTGRYVSDYRLLLPDGQVRHIRAIGQVFRETDGSAQIVGVNWDVTADVQRNAELEAKRREAEGASVAKSQFLATMSHEIRTPMNGVIGMLDLILRTETDPVRRERAEIACESAHHLLQILNDILDLSKLEANRITLEPGPVDVRRLARDVVALMAAGAAGRDLAVTAELAPELPDQVVCDPTRLRQVMMNLVGNAVKFTDAGSVTLAVGRGAGDRLEVAVRDTGVGIPEEAKRTLFERFNQIELVDHPGPRRHRPRPRHLAPARRAHGRRDRGRERRRPRQHLPLLDPGPRRRRRPAAAGAVPGPAGGLGCPAAPGARRRGQPDQPPDPRRLPRDRRAQRAHGGERRRGARRDRGGRVRPRRHGRADAADGRPHRDAAHPRPRPGPPRPCRSSR